MNVFEEYPIVMDHSSPAAYYAAKAEGIPEVQTLHNYRLLCPNALESYSEAVVRVLNNKKMIADLKQRCRESALKYTIEKMVSNFVNGVLKSLEMK
jgi:hypothetical protein